MGTWEGRTTVVGHKLDRKWRVMVAVLIVLIALVSGFIWYLASGRSAEQAAPTGITSSVIVPVASSPSESSANPDATITPELETVIRLTYAPAAAIVTIDGVVIQPDNQVGTVVPVEPGKHSVSIKMTGFKSYSRSFTLESGDWYPIMVALESNDPSTKKYYSNHIDDEVIREGASEPMINLWTVIDLFPYQGNGFEISVGQSSNSDDFWLDVTCHLAMISHNECRMAVIAAVGSDPISLNPYSYVIKFHDV